MAASPLKEKTKALLRKSEKYTKTDMVYLARGGFWQLVERMAMISVGLVSTWTFANLLPKTTYGEYKYILSLASLLTTFSLTGVTTAVAKAVARGYEGTYRKAFWLSYKYSVVLMLVSLVGAAYYWLQGNTPLGSGLLLIAIFQPFFNTAGLYIYYLIGKKQFAKKTHRTAVYQTILSAGLICTVLLTKNLVALLSVFFILSTGISLWYYFRAYRDIPKDAPIEAGYEKYAKHLSMINVLGNIASQIDSVFLFQFTGSTALATYNVAIVIPEQFRSSNKNIATLAFAKFAEKDEQKTLAGLYRKSALLFIVLLVFALAYILIAPVAFRILFPNYMSAVFASQIFALSIPFSSSLYQTFFEANGRVKEQYIIKLLSGSIRIATLVLFIPFLGLMGAVYARLASRVLQYGLSLFLAFNANRRKASV